MTQRVKQFIEKNIETIELNRWEELFDTWYDETTAVIRWEDVDEIQELFRVLETLDVTTETTEAARRSVIEQHVESILLDIQHKNYNRVGKWYIRWILVLVDLNSTLGFTHADLHDILNEIDLSGVTPDYNNQRFVIDGL